MQHPSAFNTNKHSHELLTNHTLSSYVEGGKNSAREQQECGQHQQNDTIFIMKL